MSVHGYPTGVVPVGGFTAVAGGVAGARRVVEMVTPTGVVRVLARTTGCPYLAVVPVIRRGGFTGGWEVLHVPSGSPLSRGVVARPLDQRTAQGVVARIADLDWSDPDPVGYRDDHRPGHRCAYEHAYRAACRAVGAVAGEHRPGGDRR